jgi:TRAP-type C4-dicarboxylate transport system permease small subunit
MTLRSGVLAVAKAMDRAIDAACRLLMLATGLGLLTLLTVVVVMRYAMASGLSSAPEMTELMFAIFVMAGIVQAARMGVHVATQLLLHILEGKWRTRLAVLIHVVIAATYAQLAWYATLNANIAHDQHTPVLNIPYSVGYGCLALGLALVALCSVLAIIRHMLSNEGVRVDLADPGAAVT